MTQQIKTLIAEDSELDVAAQKLDDMVNEFLKNNPNTYMNGEVKVVDHPALYIFMQQLGYFVEDETQEIQQTKQE